MSEENPYQSPTASCEPESDVDRWKLPLASTRQRFFNHLLDYLAVQALTFVFAMVLVMSDRGSEWLERPANNLLLGLFLSLGYYVPFEFFSGRTPGKWVTGTRVITDTGGLCTLTQIVGRTLCRWIPFEPLSFLRGKNPVGWHDRYSGTRVVSISSSY